ncbi:MAG: DUF3536 domain-containing protein [Chloroflexi bacterium]|nr:DUF3536 domain-containing protein [Chloroflexota bacterium]
MATKQVFVVHAHFYQPPRGNPFSPESLAEPTAAPFKNWNERIAAECYTPNAEAGNLPLISFNLGETLAQWLESHVPETYQAFLAADAQNASDGLGNALAQPMHHTILPASRPEDQQTQVAWGIRAFEHRFGRKPTGMWLPEMAVDLPVLQVLRRNGIEWTILSGAQIVGDLPDGGPYWVDLPDGERIKVFVRDDALSNSVSFELNKFGGAGKWARTMLIPRRRTAGELTLLALDGETFGHHWPGEHEFLHWLLTYEAHSAGYEVTTLSRYLQDCQPTQTIEIKENSAWSSDYGLGRWVTGSADTEGESYWKGGLRRALDILRGDLDYAYQRVALEAGVADPIALREAYIDVILGSTDADKFLKAQDVSVKGDQAKALSKLIEAQFYRQRMFVSCAFYFTHLHSLEPRYAIANAAYAIQLTKQATGLDFGPTFRKDLTFARVEDEETGTVSTAATIYDDVLVDMP